MSRQYTPFGVGSYRKQRDFYRTYFGAVKVFFYSCFVVIANKISKFFIVLLQKTPLLKAEGGNEYDVCMVVDWFCPVGKGGRLVC